MRVQYTLPGLQPQRTPSTVEPGRTSGPSFKGRLRRLSTAIPVSWRQMLRLDRPPVGPATIGPPPRPVSLEVKDVAAERLRWRNLLERQSQSFAGLGVEPAGPKEMRKVQRMLTLLLHYQELEDRVISHHLAESRG